MFYDPIKDRLGRVFGRHPVLQRLFFALLHLFFLRAWYVRREVRRVLGALPADTRIDVLDAGTGFAQYAYFVARAFPNAQILAVDIKRDYLDTARRFFERTRLDERVDFAYEDLTRLQAEGPFDLILSVDVMEHIEDDQAVFRHFAHVLRPGGHVLINTPSNLGGSDVREEGDTSFIEEHVRDGYDRDELEGKLCAAGLTPVRSLYTYGRYGGLAWRMLIQTPMRMLGTSWAFAVVLPVYYLVTMPVGLVLHALDMRRDNAAGTGLLVVARREG
jgi:SAM-dependent methyltransferase